jgi:peptidoglycan-N-acetylglucosamine deacetylase
MRKLLLLPLSIILVLITLNVPIAHAQAYTHAGGSVALTFDDGPSAFTAGVLNVLQQHGVHATFFCIGQQVQTRPAIVREVSQAGNVIGNHSWSHPDLTKLAPNQVTWQLSTTSTAIQQATGISPTLFRPPYGALNAMVTRTAAQLGLSPVLWNIDTLDWTRPGVNAIVSSVLDHAVNGSIVLMHDGGGDRSETIQALPQIISGLRARGFAFVTATPYD